MESYRRQALVVAEGPRQGASYPLQGTAVTLGRATDNTIVLDSANISRHHAQIRLSATGATIEDLGSTNGTWVNNYRLFDPQPLMPGDMIRLADYVTFRYVVAPHAGGPAIVEQGGRGETPHVTGQEVDYDQPRVRAYESTEYVDPYPSAPPVTPDYAPPSQRPEREAIARAPHRDDEERRERSRPKWLYVVIGVLVVLLCLCVATAVYIWFAPVEFWEWLFNLFNIPLPNGSLRFSLLLFR
jgi:hypothetical protein